jgi:hypothetical protein
MNRSKVIIRSLTQHSTKDDVKVDSVVKLVAEASCSLYAGAKGQNSGPLNCWRSADYVERFGHHAIDIRSAVVVCSEIAYCPIEAVKLTQKKLK